MQIFSRRFILCVLIFLCSSITINTSFSCTRILNSDNTQAVLVGRTMDWHEDMHTNLFAFPHGMKRDGKALENAYKWTAKYNSIAATAYDVVTTDGMNEKGFAAHILWLSPTNYGVRDKKIPAISVALWAQFYLDSFATVDEAVSFTNRVPFQIESLVDPKTHEEIKLHLALEDASGDSAIIEYIDGKANVYHDRKYVVLTNAPTFDKQIRHLSRYIGFGGDQALPGSTSSEDRFVRASYYTVYLPTADSLQAALTNLLSVIQTIVEPFSTATPNQHKIGPTIWRSVTDLTNRVYYFNDSRHLDFIKVKLNNLNLKNASSILKLDLHDGSDLAGDVTNKFKPATHMIH